MLDKAQFDTEYLRRINDAAGEKADMREHLSPLGAKDVILEIGPGGAGALEVLLADIKAKPIDDRPTVVSVDLSSDALFRAREAIQAVNTGVDANEEVRAFPIQANAIRLPFRDASVSVANLSSVVHEVFSYEGGEEGIDMLVKEIVRVLKHEGIVTYRDPEGVELFKTSVSFLKSDMIRSFAVVFLRYFIDSSKELGPQSRYAENCVLSLDGKRKKPSETSMQECLKAETVLLSGYAGITHELKRHFVVFMTTFFPEVFKCVEQLSEEPDMVKCNFGRNSGAAVFKTFFANDEAVVRQGDNERMFYVRKPALDRFEAATKAKFDAIFMEQPLICANERDVKVLTSFLDAQKVPYRFVTEKDNRVYVHFEDLLNVYPEMKAYLRKHDCSVSTQGMAEKTCLWFQCEGRESYFYGDAIDILISFVEKSMIRDREHSVIGYSCLIPTSLENSVHVSRTEYAQYVRSCCVDIEGHYDDGKRNIHFVKKPLEKAFDIIFALYQRHGDERLRQLLSRLLGLTKTSLDTEKSHREKRETETALLNESTSAFPVIGLAGGIASGKSSISEILCEYNFTVFEISDLIRRELEDAGVVNPKRADYFEVANARRREGGYDYWAKKTVAAIGDNPPGNLVISGIRTPEEVAYLRASFRNFVLVGVTAPEDVRVQRVKMRSRDIDPQVVKGMLSDMNREMSDNEPEGCKLGKTIEQADFLVDSSTNMGELRENCLALIRQICDIIS